MLNPKILRFPIDIILVCIRWYAVYPLSYRHIEEIMEERGVFVDHSLLTAGQSAFCRYLKKLSASTSEQLVWSGVWSRRTLRSNDRCRWKFNVFCIAILLTDGVNQSSLKNWQIWLSEIWLFVVNATEPVSKVKNWEQRWDACIKAEISGLIFYKYTPLSYALLIAAWLVIHHTQEHASCKAKSARRPILVAHLSALAI